MALPVAATLLWLGRLPPPKVMGLGLFTVFAGYAAVYALNDLIDYRTDRAGFLAGEGDATGRLEAVYARHPIAMGLLSFRQGFFWTVGWAAAALAGSFLLNPACALVMLAGCGLEALYCGLRTVWPLRALTHGVVKTLGGVAAVLAVDPGASGLFVALAVAPVFLWEIGGQNIPADWFDVETDRRQGARTLCVALGPDVAARVSLLTLCAATLLTVVALHASPAGLPASLIAFVTAINLAIMPWSAWKLMRRPSREMARGLFARASLFPAVMLAAAAIWFIVR